MNETLIPPAETTDVAATSPSTVLPDVPPAAPAPLMPAAPAPKRSAVAVTALLLSVVAVLLSAGALVLTLTGGWNPTEEPEPVEPDPMESAEPSEPEEPEEPAFIVFRDQQLPLENVALNEYETTAFITGDSGHITYSVDGCEAIPGVDVSAFQKEVDWKQVKASGMEFAILRVGFRGYGAAGVLVMDEYFEKNIAGALEAGLKVGVYFFSQAINVEEAQEEARFVLDAIDGYELAYPVFFDWERITNGENARTDGLPGKAVTQCVKAFCEVIAEAGYMPAVYFNQTLGYLSLDLEELDQYPFWLAAYSSSPGFHYHFDMWQYSAKGRVPGIQGNVDLNLSFRDFAAE